MYVLTWGLVSIGLMIYGVVCGRLGSWLFRGTVVATEGYRRDGESEAAADADERLGRSGLKFVYLSSVIAGVLFFVVTLALKP